LAVISPNIIQTTRIQEKMKNKTPMEDRLDGASNFNPWKSIQSMSGRETLPTFERLWIDCTQEELRLINRGVEDYPEENHALALHTRKGGKFKRNFKQTFKEEKPSSNSGYQRRDLSKVQCYRCDKYGHIAKYCPTRKKGKQYATTVDIDPDPPQENEERRNKKYFLQEERCDK
jgi:hypothetical protein